MEATIKQSQTMTNATSSLVILTVFLVAKPDLVQGQRSDRKLWTRTITSYEQLHSIQRTMDGARPENLKSLLREEDRREGWSHSPRDNARRHGRLAGYQAMLDADNAAARAAGFQSMANYLSAARAFLESQRELYLRELNTYGEREAGSRYHERVHYFSSDLAEKRMQSYGALEPEEIMRELEAEIEAYAVELGVWRLRGEMYQIYGDRTYRETPDELGGRIYGKERWDRKKQAAKRRSAQ